MQVTHSRVFADTPNWNGALISVICCPCAFLSNSKMCTVRKLVVNVPVLIIIAISCPSVTPISSRLLSATQVKMKCCQGQVQVIACFLRCFMLIMFKIRLGQSSRKIICQHVVLSDSVTQWGIIALYSGI